MPARAERVARRSVDQYTPGGFNSLTSSRSGEIYEVVLYFGIIDILQDYDITKKLEHAYKSLQVDPTSISAVDPKHYSKRFRDFVGRIFIEDRWSRMQQAKQEASWSNQGCESKECPEMLLRARNGSIGAVLESAIFAGGRVFVERPAVDEWSN